MLQIHQGLKAVRYPNCRTLAEELEVSTKTIQRDVEFMRERLGLPIDYDELKFGFYYTEHVAGFPAIEVSEGEVVALFVAEKALEQHKGTPYEKPLKAAFEKITAGLRGCVDLGLEEVDASISFRSASGEAGADPVLFQVINKAVLHSREITFDYRKLKGSKHERRRVQPYHLACIKNFWYLFAYDRARKEVRTFALPRIRKVKETGEKFHKPADFSIARHLSGSFGVVTGKETRKVRIRFTAPASRMVEERRWHPTQSIEQTENGIILGMELNSLEEIKNWILGWGPQAEALEPPELVGRVRAAVEEMGRLYAK